MASGAGYICKTLPAKASYSVYCVGEFWMLPLMSGLGALALQSHVAVGLSEDSRRQLWIPRSFAHGFVVLSEIADFFSKCDEYYTAQGTKSLCAGNDPVIGVAALN